MLPAIPKSQSLALSLALLAAVALLIAAPTAGAASATTDSLVEIPLGKSGKGLRTKGVKAKAVSPAKIKSGVLNLRVSDVSVDSATKAAAVLRGGVKLTHKRKSVKLAGLLLNANGKKLTISGKIGSKRLALFSGTSKTSLVVASTQTILAPAIELKLETKASRLIRKSLGLRALRGSELGKLGAIAKTDLPKPPALPGGTLQDLAGPPLARPAGAVDVTAASLKWWVRDSWIRYLPFNLAQDGATADAPISGGSHACPDSPGATADSYAFNLVFKNGWWDVATQTGALYYGGGVRWYFPDHGIDIVASGAEIELNGGASRAIFRFDDNAEHTSKRGAFVSLNVAAPMNGVAPVPGGAISRLKSTIFTDPATSPFGSFVTQYESTPGWGCFDLGFNT